MKLFLFLNELSEIPPAANLREARGRMERFVQLLAGVRDGVKLAQPVLRSLGKLHDIELGPEYPVARWQNDPEVEHVLRQLLLAMSVQAELFPKDDEAPENMDEQECFHRGRPALAVNAALLLDGLPVSLASDPCWDTHELKVTAHTLDHAANDVKIQEDLPVRHASAVPHLTKHEKWFEEVERVSVRDGRDLWDRREELFPSIEFCREVRGQLRGFKSGDRALRQVMKRLAQLQAFFATWGGAPISPDAVPSKCTPESDQTLKKYEDEHTFTRASGARKIFSWHVRFAPEPGRIFFDGDAEERKGLLGCIARDGLPTIQSPT